MRFHLEYLLFFVARGECLPVQTVTFDAPNEPKDNTKSYTKDDMTFITSDKDGAATKEELQFSTEAKKNVARSKLMGRKLNATGPFKVTFARTPSEFSFYANLDAKPETLVQPYDSDGKKITLAFAARNNGSPYKITQGANATAKLASVVITPPESTSALFDTFVARGIDCSSEPAKPRNNDADVISKALDFAGENPILMAGIGGGIALLLLITCITILWCCCCRSTKRKSLESASTPKRKSIEIPKEETPPPAPTPTVVNAPAMESISFNSPLKTGSDRNKRKRGAPRKSKNSATPAPRPARVSVTPPKAPPPAPGIAAPAKGPGQRRPTKNRPPRKSRTGKGSHPGQVKYVPKYAPKNKAPPKKPGPPAKVPYAGKTIGCPFTESYALAPIPVAPPLVVTFATPPPVPPIQTVGTPPVEPPTHQGFPIVPPP